jgi:hypothetical protein|mmetsp:Transcript_91206/g.142368  ORF Transcript_91206/g.142368 Transcript_91206/m.142368 type:complete len:448 (+) Transcript_91206:49-1392(+)
MAKVSSVQKKKALIQKVKKASPFAKKLKSASSAFSKSSTNEGTYVPKKGERGTGLKFALKTYQTIGAFKPGTLIKYGPNPKSIGSKSYARFEGYRHAKTVGESLKCGSKVADLLWEFERGMYTVIGGERSEAKEIQAIGQQAFESAKKSLAAFNGPRGLAFNIHDKRAAGQLEKEEAWRLAKINRCEALAKEFGLKPEMHVDLVDELGISEDSDLRLQRRVADEMSRRKLNSGKKLSEKDMTEVLDCWGFGLNVGRTNVTPEGQKFVYSDTVGGIRVIAKGYGPTRVTTRYPNFVRFLNKWLKDNLPASVKDDFVSTAINLNANYAGRRHRDGNNEGPSIIRAFGKFTGGELKYWPRDLKVAGQPQPSVEDLNSKDCVTHNIKNKTFIFDGNRAHEVTPFQGNRFSVVYFSTQGYAKFKPEDVKTLKSLGFVWPTPESMARLKRKTM